MPWRKPDRGQRTRELRRRVLLPARLRYGASWSDTCILNVSSRGMLIQTGRPLANGSEVEIRRGDHIIVAHVVWREGSRTGLCAADLLPIEQIVGPPEAQPVKALVVLERRLRSRNADSSRRRGRAFEFASVTAIGFSLAAIAASMAQQALARPLALVAAALAR